MDNYFNYFTEIEAYYQRCRGAPVLLSALDWALIDSWREAGIPLEAVQRGVERTFEKFERKRRHKFLKVNGLSFCTQQVMLAAAEAQRAAVEGGPGPARQAKEDAPFTSEEIRKFVEQCVSAIDQAAVKARAGGGETAGGLDEAAGALREIARQCVRQNPGEAVPDLEGLERSLTAIEEKLTASLIRGASVDLLARFHEEVDRGITPFRRTMSAFQIESLQRQFLRRQLLDYHGIPRLSLFYLHP